MKKRVLVLGGYGSYGKRISESLAKDPDIECIAVGRNPPSTSEPGKAITYLALDCRHTRSLEAVLPGAFVVINAMGSFYDRDYTIARLCADNGAHYIDLADTRDYIAGFQKLNRKAQQTGTMLVTGAGFMPTISSVLVDSVTHQFDRITQIMVYRSLGNRNPGGVATLSRLLDQLGSTVRIKIKGRWQNLPAWSKPRTITFPRPAGKRRVYLCDSPDLDVLVQRYGANTVSYRTGFELNLFNFGVSVISWLRRKGKISEPARMARILSRVGTLLRHLGSDHDAMGVVVRGSDNEGNDIEQTVYLVGFDGSGPVIPTSPAVVLAKKWVRDGVGEGLAGVGHELVSMGDLRAELKEHNVVMVRH